ncbi:MAG: bifunctional DNA-formamidopyrimidine glycosylase/DNA-(apurinic or apyrimidinic site) lyase [Pseudomonadota bacterium]|nr:bifunctional DNA-formamidopyrimidine glycosylase/DNA-(apurinic or apyrimidinic site) lyase [Pseudomonadota bacterium]
MPELPEVETVRRGLAPTFIGARLARVETRRPDLRFPFPERFAERLQGRLVQDLRRRAKYLLADLDSGETLAMHLGMSGSFRIEDVPVGEFNHPRGKGPTHDHVVFHFEAGPRVVYNDPRRFGFMQLAATATLERHPLFAGLGVEPLSDAFDAAALSGVLGGARAPLKSALLDQRRIAGLGNIYVCEALHRARLSPLREAGGLTPAEARRLAKAIREVLGEAIEVGGSTLRDHRQADGNLGYFQHSFVVYDREGAACGRCGALILRKTQSGRSTFYCAACQR